MLQVNIDDGGTNAGNKKPLKEKGRAWECCGTGLAGYWATCPKCGRERP